MVIPKMHKTRTVPVTSRVTLNVPPSSLLQAHQCNLRVNVATHMHYYGIAPPPPAINALDVNGRVLCNASKLASIAPDQREVNLEVWHHFFALPLLILQICRNYSGSKEKIFSSQVGLLGNNKHTANFRTLHNRFV